MATEQEKQPQGGNAVMQLLRFAGSRRWLAFAGSALAAVNGILTVVPLVLVWFVLRDFVAVAPHFEEATDATLWAWLAFGAAVLGALCYFAGLMLTHTAAFRVAANMCKAC
ncbi:MAG: ABC transporter ATP-binding protein, partial [Adlercreutzia sp.]